MDILNKTQRTVAQYHDAQAEMCRLEREAYAMGHDRLAGTIAAHARRLADVGTFRVHHLLAGRA